MKRKKNYFDIILMVLLIALVVSLLLGTLIVFNVFIFSLNDFLGLCLLLFATRLFLYNSITGQYLLLIALIVDITNVVNIQYTISDVTYSSSSTASFGSFGFNPGAFLLFIFYTLINRRNVMSFIRKILNGSDEEQIENHNKKVNFYYDQFNGCDLNELTDIFDKYLDYPDEAKIALRKIHHEKNLSLLSF